MKKIISIIFFSIFFFETSNSENIINRIYEGNIDAKIKLIVYESLTCSHCADFHKNVYPNLKKDFIDKNLIKIEFRNFPLDMAAFNASKLAHCRNDGKSEILHFLYNNQNKWVKNTSIKEINSNLKELIKNSNFKLDFDKCIQNKNIEDFVLEDRIEAVKKFEINATPTLIINNKKFEKPLTYKNIKKTLEKLI
tara:strand:+ start:696 stop:1277 length:582 start_codon:yes stop_codon:yes gene_type:complete